MTRRPTRLRLGVLATAATATLAAGTLVGGTSAIAANPVITVDLSSSQGAVTYGASGSLYALSNDGSPSDDKLSGLKVPSIGQMAPNGAQHPDGDANKVAPEFFRQDGSELQVYVQDYYAGFPYPNPGVNSYLNVVTTVVNSVKNQPNSSKYTLVPFNEPDNIWYGSSGTNLTNFENDWKTVFQKIRSLWPSARIAGPNFFQYNSSAFRSFYTFAKNNNVLPNLTTWHELQSNFFTNWYNNINDYRSMESSIGISHIPVNINEYGRSSGDMGIPGQMIQFISRFENSRVSGNMAAWAKIGDIGQTLTDSNFSKASAWYLYRWYGERTGNDVSVSLPSQTGSLQATASLAATKQQASVILGGGSGSTNVVVKGFGSTSMGGTVHVSISAIANSGGNASGGPTTVSQGDYTVSGGQITVTVPNLVAANAYNVVVTAGAGSAFDPNRLYKVLNVNSGKAVEDYNYGTVDNSTVDQYTYSGDAHMQWYIENEGGGYYKVVNGYSGKVLDDYNNDTGDGARVDQYTWSGGNNQLWTITNRGSGRYEFLNRTSGKALEVYNNSTADLGVVDQWPYSGGNNQLWTIS